MHAQRQIRQAWETFLDRGEAAAGVPDLIMASWQRSRRGGVSASRLCAPMFSHAEIHRRRLISAELLQASRAALERSRLLLRDASSIMILTDPKGFIIETAGDPRVIDAGRDNHLEIGGHWDESVIGTNAIGTALVEGRPTEIRGTAHFCEDVQRWTCAATPIRHPIDKEMLGIVDISGPITSFNPQSLALAMSIGQEIEASLAHTARVAHEHLLRGFLSKRSLWLNDEMIVVDRRGFIVHATERAARRLDADPERLAAELRQMIGGEEPGEWNARCQRRFPNASAEVIRHADGEIGCLIVVRAPRALSSSTARAKAPPGPTCGFTDIVGQSAAIREARARAAKLGANALSILIEGETGVGKELFARAIKEASSAANGPFVPLNCGGMPRDLIASELFGYAKGAFTGADPNGRAGRIEQADGGVLCLDEIGEMPLDLQSYLLRVLEDGIVYRIGEAIGRRVNIRIVSMTNRNLAAEIEAGRFRSDLYYRIAAARLRIPPLRDRPEDIEPLARSFVARAAERNGKPPPALSPALVERLSAYSWPGNVRELRNVIDAMVALADTDRLDIDDLPPEQLQEAPRTGLVSRAGVPSMSAPKRRREDAEREEVLAVVQETGGNLAEAARRLGIARSTLYTRLEKYRAGS